MIIRSICLKKEEDNREKIICKVKEFSRIVIILTIIALALIKVVTLVKIEAFNNYNKRMEEVEFIQVVVGKGETAYNLQKELTPHENVNEMLYYAKVKNAKNLGDIKAGEVIFLVNKK